MKLGHGGGSGGMGGIGVDPNARVLAVLAQMGIAGASELPDGSIRLPDGRIVGQFGSCDGDEAGTGGVVSQGLRRGGFGMGSSRMLKGLPACVQMMVEGLENDICGSKRKLQVYSPGA